MVSLWQKNRVNFIKSHWSPPAELDRKAGEGFNAFKTRTLEFYYGREKVKGMSVKIKNKLFNKHYRGRTVYKYNMYFKGGKAITEKIPYKVPRRHFESPGVITEELRQCLPIATSRTCLYRGTVPFPVGFKPQKVRGQSHLWLKYLRQTKQQGVYAMDPERVEVFGSWPSQVRELQAMADPVEHDADYVTIRSALVNRLNTNLKIPKILPPTEKDCYAVQTSQKSFTGVMTSRFIGATHRKADPISRNVAASLWRQAGSKILSDNTLWAIAGRSRYQKYKEGDPCRSRLILAPEAHTKIFALTYASRIYAALTHFIKAFPDSACQIGLNYNYKGFEAFEKEFASVRNIVADLKRHDQNNSEQFLVAAFALIRSCFPPSVKIDRHFMFFMSGTIFKNVVVPGRFIYKILKGNPSGSPFTSLLSTFCNVLQWGCTLERAYGVSSTRIKVACYGDDTLGSLPDGMKAMPEDHMIRLHKQVTGHSCDPFKYQNWYARDPSDRPTFLKAYSESGLPARTISDAIFSLANPSSDNPLAVADTCTSLCYTSPFNIRLIDIALGYRDWLRRRYYQMTGNHSAIPIMCGMGAYQATIRNAFTRFAFDPIYGFVVTKARLPWMEGEKGTCGFTPMSDAMAKALKDNLGFEVYNTAKNVNDLSTYEVNPRWIGYS